jgi:integrase
MAYSVGLHAADHRHTDRRVSRRNVELADRAKWAGPSDRSFTFHALRHTFATTLLRQNVNPKIVQHQLGHATISQTMDTYSHVMPDMSDVAAAALEAAFS